MRKTVGSIYNVNSVIDPEAWLFVMQIMEVETGMKILYYTLTATVLMDENNIKKVLIVDKSKRSLILAKFIFDCKGYGNIFHHVFDNNTNN